MTNGWIGKRTLWTKGPDIVLIFLLFLKQGLFLFPGCTEIHNIAQTSLELKAALLSQPPEACGCRHEPLSGPDSE